MKKVSPQAISRTYSRWLLITLLSCGFLSRMNSQTHFRYTSNTGENATVGVPWTANPNINGSPLVAGDEIGVFTPGGLCVGATVWNESGTAITVWGDNSQTTDTIDGMRNGEQIHYRVWRNSTNTEYTVVSVTYQSGNGIYTANGLYVLSSLSATAPPDPPALKSPADGATDQQTSLTLEWNASSSASSYRLQVSANPSFSPMIIDESGIPSTSHSVSGLLNNTTYFWRLQAVNAGGASAWSTVWRFTTIIAPPAVPMLVSPTNGTVNVPTSPTLDWDSSARASSYHLQLSNDSTFASTVLNQTGLTATSYTAAELMKGTTYYWRVQASNVGGQSGWSSTWSFTTIIAAPSAPTLASPDSSAVDVSTNPTLMWNGPSGAASYRLQVSTDPNFTAPSVIDATGLTSPSYSANGLLRYTTYFWRVNASNAGGTSGWSSVWTFTTIPNPPAQPTLLSPPDDATGQPIDPTLSWRTSAGATMYRLQVSTSPNFSPLVYDSTLTQPSQQVGPLSYNTWYYWRVNAGNSGGSSVWSAIFKFRTLTSEEVPGPSLVSPQSGLNNQPTTLTLVWKQGELPGAVGYHLQVSTNANFTSPLVINNSSITDTSHVVGSLANGTLYYWRVRIRYPFINSQWSAIWNFTTVPDAPNAPSLASPDSGETDVPTSLTLTWNTSPGAISYRLQVFTTADTVINQSGITTTWRTVSGLNNGVRYYWRVNATNGGGTSSWSSVWSFTTVPLPPAAPTLVSPQNGATNQPTSLTFTWNRSEWAAFYRLQVSENSNFTPTAFDDSMITSTSRDVDSLDGITSYFWQVNARNSAGTSNWSETRTVTTGSSGSQQRPTLNSPPDGSDDQPLTMTLRWNSFPAASQYQLQVSTVQNFSSTVYNISNITDTSQQIGPLTRNTRYYWRVKAFILTIPTDWSDVWNFRTIPFPPAAPTLASPTNGATGISTNPVLAWNAANGATRYHLQVATTSSFTFLVFEDTTITGLTRQAGPLAVNTTYHWRVRARNSGGWGVFSSPFSFTTVAGGLATAITNAPSGVTATSAKLNATVNPNGLSTAVKFQYGPTISYGNAVNAEPPVLTGASPQDCSAQLEGLTPNTTYHYRVWTTNSAGTSYGEDKWFITPPNVDTYNLNVTIDFPFYDRPIDYQPTEYRIVGLPGASNAVVSTLLPGVQDRDWQVYWDNGAPTGNLVVFNGGSNFRFSVGQAFWLIKKGPWTVNTTVPVPPLNPQQEAEIPLHSGWNLISNPFDSSAPWATIQSANSVSTPIYSFNGTFQISADFGPYVGYYFFNATNLSFLRIPYSATTTASSSSGQSNAPMDWSIRVNASAGGLTDKSLWLGVARHAEIEKDQFDVHKPRAIGPSLNSSFHRPNWDREYSSFATDVRPPFDRIEKWKFDIHAKMGRQTHLHFGGIHSVPMGLQVYLLDAMRGRATNLRLDSTYSFLPVTEISSFVIAIGTEEAMVDQLQSFPRPGEFKLSNNFPNPFNAMTWISMEIPTPSEITLKIYDILGREIRTLHSGFIEAGRHWLPWDSKDQRGIPVASGMYFYRLQTKGGFSETHKMILTK